MTDVPAMMLWTDAYLGDTRHLTTVQHGAYLLIMMAMWRNGGSLPNDEKRLCRTAGLTIDKWRKMVPVLMELFTIEGDQITQKRLSQELKIALGRREKMKLGGRAGYRAKMLKNMESGSRGAYESDKPALSNHNPIDKKEISKDISKKDDPKKASRKRRSAIAEDTQPNENQRAYAAKAGMTMAEFRFEWQRFRDHHLKVGSLFADWNAAWRTWAAKWTELKGKPAPSDPSPDNPPERIVRLPGGIAWPESRIRRAIAAYEENPGSWPESALGSPPGQPGCLIPDDLIPDRLKSQLRVLVREVA